jgi:DNA-binding transcriptional ArsR family regulator
MDSCLNIASAAFLIADPTRAAMLVSLLDGQMRPAGELASAAGVTPQTASSHLSKLLAGGLLKVEVRGRHRYYRLGGSHIAFALETLAFVGVTEPARRKPASREAQSLAFARCCYDHLAGRIGVAITQGLLAREFLLVAADKRYEVTPTGADWFFGMGLDVTKLKPNRRGLARQCLDWTERKHHLSGPLGVTFMSLLCSNDWLRRSKVSRVVRVTPKGWVGLKEELGVDASAIGSQ